MAKGAEAASPTSPDELREFMEAQFVKQLELAAINSEHATKNAVVQGMQGISDRVAQT